MNHLTQESCNQFLVIELNKNRKPMHSASMMTKTATGKFRNIVNGIAGANDKIIFGTGDNLVITTMTGDAKFVRGASA